MPKGIFQLIPSYQRRQKEVEALAKVWPRLAARKRAIILITAGVWETPNPYERAAHRQAKKGETPAWLIPALNLLRDSGGQLSDREIARRVGVSHSTLVRNKTYMRARESMPFVPRPRKVVTVDPRILAKREFER